MNDEPCTHDDVECLVCCDCGVAFESGEELRVARREAQRDPKEPDDEEREARP